MLAIFEDPKKIELEVFSRARSFVLENRDVIFKLAYRLYVQRRLTGKECKRIFGGTENVTIPLEFFKALREGRD